MWNTARRLLLLFLAAGFAGSASAEPLSHRAFTDEVIAAFQKTGAANCVRRVDEAGFSFGQSESECDNQKVFTDRSYSEYLEYPDTKADIVARLVSVGLESFQSKEPGTQFPNDYMERLVLIVRPIDYGQEIMTDGAPLLSRPFVGYLSAFVALDSADRLMVPSRASLPDQNKTDDEWFALAEANTRKRIGKLDFSFVSGAWQVTAESGLAPSLLALPDSCSVATESFLALVVDGFNYLSAYTNDASSVADISQIARIGIESGGLPGEPLLLCENGKWTAKAPD